MRTGLDLDAVNGAAGKIEAILGALHVVRRAFRRRGGRLGALPLTPHQFGVFPGKVFLFVTTGLVRLHA